jgi:hypothetical protein
MVYQRGFGPFLLTIGDKLRSEGDTISENDD